jgi:hypothetical protein
MLISAAVGAGTGAAGSAISGGDPLKGALTGAALGAVTGGVGSSIGGLSNTALSATEAAELAKASALADSSMAGAQGITQLPAGMPNAALDANTAIVQNQIAQQSQVPNLLAQNPTSAEISGLSNANTAPVTPSTTPVAPKGAFDFGYKGPTPNVFEYGPQSNLALGGIGTTSGISAAMQAERDKYAVPTQEKYTGPLSRFKYDPSTYNPDIVRPPNPPYKAVYAAEGGIMSLAPNGYAMGGMPPRTNFANPSSYEQGTSQYSMATDPMSGNIAQRMAEGGITSLGSYSDGGRLLRGPGDGMSDDIPARIGRKQEARLADGEFVIPADVVSHLGNGSTDAGAKTLYAMMNKVRKARTGTKKQGRQIESSSYLPA